MTGENKPIELMDLSELQENITELPMEQLLEYLSGTRNNRLKKAPPKTKKARKKKAKVEAEDQLVGLLAALGPDAMKILEDIMGGES